MRGIVIAKLVRLVLLGLYLVIGLTQPCATGEMGLHVPSPANSAQ